jgi:hypothetical protein
MKPLERDHKGKLELVDVLFTSSRENNPPHVMIISSGREGRYDELERCTRSTERDIKRLALCPRD